MPQRHGPKAPGAQGIQSKDFDGVAFLCEYIGESHYASRACHHITLKVDDADWDKAAGISVAVGRMIRVAAADISRRLPRAPKPVMYEVPEMTDMKQGAETILRMAMEELYDLLRRGSPDAKTQAAFGAVKLLMPLLHEKTDPEEDPVMAQYRELMKDLSERPVSPTPADA